MRIGRYFRFIGKLSMAKLTKRRIPLIVILGVTNKCNLNCWYCYGEHPHRNDWIDFTIKELLEIVRALHKLGTQVLQLQGGEPLLRDDLQIIINEARKFGMICDMVTNGILISQRKETVRLLDKICISLDGPPKVNDRNRGKGTYEQIVEGIKVACNLGLPVRINTMLTSMTSIEDINWLIDFAYKHHILVNFSPSFEFVPQVQTNKIRPYEIDNDYLRSLFRHIVRCKIKGAPIQFSARSYNVAAQWPFAYQKRRVHFKEIPLDFAYPKCYHGEYVFFIDSDGSLYPCCNFWGRAKLNIKTDGLQKSILNLDREGCQTCYIPAYIDRNLFFDYVPKVWYNYINQATKGGA